ncbi:MAG: alpha-1,2-fucosyltransferase [Bacteroidetes bacterium]|nr:alpha-1,2-fucosyltransferase [Bacteroidota bacterium]
MIYTKIHYGLGNQLFQYALGRRLSLDLGTDFSLCLDFFQEFKDEENPRLYQLNHFNIIENIASEEETRPYLKPNFLERRMNNLLHPFLPYYKRKLVLEQQLDFDGHILKVKDGSLLAGYWQDERYFEPIKDIIKKEFSFKTPPSVENARLLEQIDSTASVSIHVRRGDYLTDAFTVNQVGGCSMEYYQQAVQYINARVEDPTYFIFSDDPDWVRAHFKVEGKTVPIGNNPQSMAYEDLRLMSHCQHHILANSSFSWWGAWLGINENKIVLAPKVWRKHGPDMFTPKGWLRI